MMWKLLEVPKDAEVETLTGKDAAQLPLLVWKKKGIVMLILIVLET